MAEDKNTISVPKAEFDRLMKRVDAMEKGNTELPVWGGVEDEREFTASFKMIEGRPLIRIENVASVGKDARGKDKMTCTAITLGKDGKEIVHEGQDYLALYELKGVDCRILDIERRPYTEKGPVVTVKVWSDKAQAEVPTGKRVTAAINFLDETFTVELPGGEVIKTKEINVPN